MRKCFVVVFAYVAFLPTQAFAYDDPRWNEAKAGIAKAVESMNRMSKDLDEMTKKNNERLDSTVATAIPSFDPEVELSAVSPGVRKIFREIHKGGGSWIIGTPGLYELAIQVRRLADKKEAK